MPEPCVYLRGGGYYLQADLIKSDDGGLYLPTGSTFN